MLMQWAMHSSSLDQARRGGPDLAPYLNGANCASQYILALCSLDQLSLRFYIYRRHSTAHAAYYNETHNLFSLVPNRGGAHLH
jgi:hypothetical protein